MKYTKYILIIIVLVGFFGPMVNIYAQTPLPSTQTVPNPTAPDSNYQLLAPLPCPPGNTAGCTDKELKTFNPAGEGGGNLGAYLNLMIKIFISLCAVLAVIMIIVGGIEYMTTELISSKEEGKKRILNAIFGLLLALGAWTILNQINPDILNTDLKTLTTQTVEVTETPATAVTTSSAPTAGPLPQCPSGVKRTAGGMVACSTIAQNIDNMLTAAKTSNLNIGGGGFRSLEDQKQARIANCNGNYTDPTAPCNPPTAIPGQSMHNSGLAFDLTCNGILIQAKDNACYLWLQANAGRFGFSNYSKEPWHWSTNGR